MQCLASMPNTVFPSAVLTRQIQTQCLRSFDAAFGASPRSDMLRLALLLAVLAVMHACARARCTWNAVNSVFLRQHHREHTRGHSGITWVWRMHGHIQVVIVKFPKDGFASEGK